MKHKTTCKLLTSAALTSVALAANAQNPSADALINKLVQKGVLTEREGKELLTEETSTNLVSASKWKINQAIKDIGLFGDVRFRYEYRAADNAAGSGSTKDDYTRERFRYAVRIGLKGDLFDNFNYGVRVETSTNPRSPWVTFGDDTNPTPFAKNSDGVNIGQAYLGWRPTDWYEMTVGKMPMPLYTTALVWDADLNPEGAVEKFKISLSPHVDLFANFGQFIYQDTNPDTAFPSSDTFLLAWQIGASAKITKDLSVKVAPVVYNYTGVGQNNLLNVPYTGEGLNGINVGLSTNAASAGPFNQNGINNLLILEVPAEVNYKVGSYGARAFGDFAYNFHGNDRARAAAQAAGPTVLSHAFTGNDKAYQVGLGFGNLGLVYGQTSKKNTWEARAYWQHVEQYALDANLLDSDFFEGRANLEGVYTAFAYSFTDAIIGTVRFGYANRIDKSLGTGGSNPDLPVLNPVKKLSLGTARSDLEILRHKFMNPKNLLFALAVSGSALAGSAMAADPMLINGAGATFPNPLYSKWFDEYTKVDPSVRFNYQSIGSGGGQKQILAQTVDFGASDGPMSDENLSKAPGKILHIPTVAGAVVITYNLPGAPKLHLDGPTIAEVFLGKITKWNDPQLAKLNPGVKLPDTDLVVVHRSDGSGTSYIFSDYLSSVSPDWEKQVGRNTSVKWPAGLGAKGNEGVAGQVKQLPGTIGYVELAYAHQNKLPVADIKNAAGNFVPPSLESVTAALAAAKVPDDFRFSMVNPPGEKAYPISGATWLLVYQQQKNPEKGKKLVEFLNWALTKGEGMTSALDYAPLPEALQQRVLERVKTIRY